MGFSKKTKKLKTSALDLVIQQCSASMKYLDALFKNRPSPILALQNPKVHKKPKEKKSLG
jgi:hypothetical protein